jgi:hypothetical protein
MPSPMLTAMEQLGTGCSWGSFLGVTSEANFLLTPPPIQTTGKRSPMTGGPVVGLQKKFACGARENEDDLGKHRLWPGGWSLDQPGHWTRGGYDAQHAALGIAPWSVTHFPDLRYLCKKTAHFWNDKHPADFRRLGGTSWTKKNLTDLRAVLNNGKPAPFCKQLTIIHTSPVSKIAKMCHRQGGVSTTSPSFWWKMWVHDENGVINMEGRYLSSLSKNIFAANYVVTSALWAQLNAERLQKRGSDPHCVWERKKTFNPCWKLKRRLKLMAFSIKQFTPFCPGMVNNNGGEVCLLTYIAYVVFWLTFADLSTLWLSAISLFKFIVRTNLLLFSN